MATPSSGDGVPVDLEDGGAHDHRDMAARNSDDGVPVDLENGGGGGLSRAEPGRNPGGAKANVKKKKSSKAKKKRKKKSSDGKDSADSYTGAALMMLVLYYFFFVFYMIRSSEKWWHAAVGIAGATAFVLLFFCLATSNQDSTKRGTRKVVKPPADSDSDLGRRLLESDSWEDDASTSGAV